MKKTQYGGNMKKFIKLLSILLCLCMLTGILASCQMPPFFFWPFGETKKDDSIFKFELNDDQESYTLVGFKSSSVTYYESLVLPDYYKGMPVTAVDGMAFATIPGLQIKQLHLPETMTTIQEDSFWHCDAIESVVIGPNVTGIEQSAFSHCENLKAVYGCQNVQYIEDRAFWDCPSLCEFYFSDTLTHIGISAFEETALTYVRIPDSVRTIEVYAFSECTSLTEMRIPETVETIEGGIVFGCTNLKSILCQPSKKPDGWSYSWSWDCEEYVQWGVYGN